MSLDILAAAYISWKLGEAIAGFLVGGVILFFVWRREKKWQREFDERQVKLDEKLNSYRRDRR